jgi:YwiC-like protein
LKTTGIYRGWQPEQPSLFRPAMKLILPKEHGSWSLALEPVALGLLAAWSIAGGGLAVAAVCGFFLRRPLKLLVGNPADERRPAALAGVIALATLAVAGLLFAAMTGGTTRLWPLAPVVLAGMVFVWFDLQNESRAGAAEIAGAMAFGLLPATFAILAGWNLIDAVALAAVMVTRSVPTVLFIRTYLRRKKGHSTTRVPAIIATMAGLLLVAWLAAYGLVPWTAAVLAAVLAVRAVWLLNAPPRLTAKTVGIAEAVFGALLVITLAFTWKIG